MEDLCFSICHNALHTPYLFKKVHRIHHQHYQPFALTSTYAHPVEYIFGNLIASSMGMLILSS